MRHVRKTIVAVVKQSLLHILSVCLCSLSYTAYKADTPYYTICGLSGDPLFRHCLRSGTIFEKKKNYLT